MLMPPAITPLIEPNPLPIILNRLLIGLIRGPTIESITLAILPVRLPIKPSTAHSKGLMKPFLIILVSRFVIVPFNAFLIVEPRHPKAPINPLIGPSAAFANALF